MPSYAGITLSLQSQYDAATIPESSARTITTPTLRSFHLDNPDRESPGLTQHPDKTFSDQQEQEQAIHSSPIIDTFIPVYQNSQFWIRYSCPPPDYDVEDVRYYYFKLFVAGKCVASWGVGEREKWKGKTMFALFDGGRDFEGRRVVVKKGFFFPGVGCGERERERDGFEVRVFRARGRRREGVRFEGASEGRGGEGGMGLTRIGKVQRGEAQRFYTYALVDAVDEPFVTFRYRFEVEDDEYPTESTLLSIEVEDATQTTLADTRDLDEPPTEPIDESSAWSSLEQNTPPSQPASTDSSLKTPRRLSFPPRNQLLPSFSRAEPSSPVKQLASASEEDLARSRGRSVQFSSIAMVEETAPRRTTGLRKPEWKDVRTSSPVACGESEGGGVASVHKKSSSGSSGLLQSVVASALKLREERYH